jgi:sigma-B regulation protein RsbQ
MSFNPVKKNNVTVINNDGERETIVFAHGFGTDQNAWSQVSSAFTDNYNVILYDNVGAGKSVPEAFSPNKYDTLHTYANDLVDICNELELKNCIMVGHSVSGMISLLAAVKKPGLFKKMVMVGANSRYLNDSANNYVGGFDQADLDGLYQTMDTNYYAWVSGFAPAAMANPDRPQLAENFAASLGAIRPDIALSVARVIFQSDHRADLSKLNIGTLLLQTKQDIAVPIQAAEYLNAHIGNSTLKVVEAEGHFPHMSAPQEIITAMKSYL